MRNPKSPMRLTTNAFLPAFAAEGLLKPEPNEEIGSETDALPSDEHQQCIACQHQNRHEKKEQIQVGEVAPVSFFVAHVADGIHMDEKANAGDDEQHEQGELVEHKAEIDVQCAGVDPGARSVSSRAARCRRRLPWPH